MVLPPPIFWKDTIIPFARRGWIAGNKEQLAADRLGEVALAGLGAGRLSRGSVGRRPRAASRLTPSPSRLASHTGSQGVVVVLLLQINRVPGHSFLCVAEKNQPDHLSSCLPSRLHV